MGETPVYVLGIGSPHGDDRFGWEVVSRLGGTLPVGVRVIAASNPLAITEVPPGCELLVIVDACRGAGSAGSVHEFAWQDLRLATTPVTSSHGIGLADALKLVEALGKLPARVIVIVAEWESAEPGCGLSSVVEAAVPKVVARVLAEIATVTRLSFG
jgi:hydrogenase maturation protease